MSSDPIERTAAVFVERLEQHQSDEELRKIQRYFKSGKGEYGEGDVFIGVRMGEVFALAKEFIDLAPDQIESLLESPVHEVRAGGLSIMDKQARRKRTPESRRKELYDLYLRRIDRINNWDLVDVSCPFVVGGYLFDFDKRRDILYTLARSANLWERRTAIVSTSYFIRQEEVADTFAIAGILLDDGEDWSTRRRAAGCGQPETSIANSWWSFSIPTPPRCHERCCATPSSTSTRRNETPGCG